MSALRAHRGRVLLAAGLAAGATAALVLTLSGGEANGGQGSAAATREWRPLSPSPLARSELAGARIGRFIYVVGGFEAPFNTTDDVARYDIDANSWELLPSLPLGVNHPAVTAHRGKLYVHGGYTGNGGLLNETDALQRFDPATGDWTTLTPSGPPRAAGTLAAINGRLYAIGGVDNGVPFRSTEIYNVAGDAWRAGPSMRVPREHLASGVLGRRIFVLGGRDGGQNLRTVERLNTRTGRWVFLPGLRVARSGFQAVAFRGRVIAVGGEELAEGNETIRQVEIYNPRRKRWRLLAPMRTPRHGHAVVSRGRRVFAIEGGPEPGLAFTNLLEFLDVPKRRLAPRR